MRMFLMIALLGLSVLVSAAIVQVAPATITATNIVDFEDLGLIGGSLVPYDDILESGLTSFSERFVGQSVIEVGGFEQLIGLPSDELSLANGPANQNLSAGNLGGNSGLSGESSLMSLGEGAVAVLFDFDQSKIAFDVLGSDIDGSGLSGTVTVSFWARNGLLLDEIVLALDGSPSISFGFITDDAGFSIAGLSLINDDAGGVGYDNFIYDVAGVVGTSGQGSEVPLPPTLILFGSALLGMLIMGKKE